MSHKRRMLDKPKINMTPMIDMVFLLLTFFVLTFRFIIPEGDFNVHLSSLEQGLPVEAEANTLQVRLLADEFGRLAAIQMSTGKSEALAIESFGLLRQRISAISAANPDLEVALFPDDHLHFEYTIQAVTAVNAEIHEGQIRKLCGKITFIRAKLE